MASSKFWPINGTGSYSPSSNTQIAFSGGVSSTGITGVSASTVTAIQALGAANVKIAELGLFLSPTGTTGTSLVFASTYSGETGLRELHYYNGNRPAFGLDGPITGVLPTVTSAALSITDASGKTVAFPADSLKQGTVYPITVYTVVTAATGSFIGFSDY